MLKVFPCVLSTYVEDLSMRLTRTLKVLPRAVFSRLVVLPASGPAALWSAQLAAFPAVGLRYFFGLFPGPHRSHSQLVASPRLEASLSRGTRRVSWHSQALWHLQAFVTSASPHGLSIRSLSRLRLPCLWPLFLRPPYSLFQHMFFQLVASNAFRRSNKKIASQIDRAQKKIDHRKINNCANVTK